MRVARPGSIPLLRYRRSADCRKEISIFGDRAGTNLRRCDDESHDSSRPAGTALVALEMQFVPQRGLVAIMAVLDIALNGTRRPISAKALAHRYGLAPRYLEPMLQMLVHDGILKGIRGPQGGYQLGRPSSSLTVDEIVRAAVDPSSTTYPPIKKYPLVSKIIMPGLEKAERAISDTLQTVTVETLLRRANALGLRRD
jgi:Rrf2 family protein